MRAKFKCVCVCGNAYVSLRACVRVCASVLARRRWEEGREKGKEGEGEKFACMPSSQAKDALGANRGA